METSADVLGNPSKKMRSWKKYNTQLIDTFIYNGGVFFFVTCCFECINADTAKHIRGGQPPYILYPYKYNIKKYI
jgi:hypothetical protein